METVVLFSESASLLDLNPTSLTVLFDIRPITDNPGTDYTQHTAKRPDIYISFDGEILVLDVATQSEAFWST